MNAMLNISYRVFYILVLLSVFSGSIFPSASPMVTKLSDDTIVSRINKQVSVYPQEKLHVHTDKSYYISGEQVWFRAHLMDAYTHLYDTTSLYVYGELINPLDSVVLRVKVINNNEAYAGYIKLEEGLPAGVYNLRFYTRFMENLGEDYFFTKNITVGTPSTLKYRTEIISTYYDNNKVNVGLIIKNVATGERIAPSEIIVAHSKEQLSQKDTPVAKKLRMNKEKSAVYKIDLGKEPIRQFYVEYEVDGTTCSEFLSIPQANDEFHVDFFPEGGRFLSGVDNIIAFKALSGEGFSTDISGVVCSEEGDTIASFITIHRGMGYFSLEGDSSKKYYAVCKNKQGVTRRFDLPVVEDEGYSLSVRQVRDQVYLSVLSPNMTSEGLKLLLHTRGHVISLMPWDAKNKVIVIPKEQLPNGVIQCMLLGKEGLPLSERLFFHFDKNSLPSISQTNNKKEYQKRDLVISDFEIKDNRGNPLNGSFSISVTDNKDVRVDSTQNMLTSLLLTSELKGHIEDPAFYFDNTKQSDYALDLLMQTQGWRRYNMSEVVSGHIQTPAIMPEFFQTISGRVKGGFFLNRKSKGTPVFLFNMKTGEVVNTMTDEDGRFLIEAVLPDSMNLMMVASTIKGQTGFKLELDHERFPEIEKSYMKSAQMENSVFQDYLEKADMKYVLENGMRTVHLKDVEITAQRKEERQSRSMYSSPFTTKIDLESTMNKDSRLLEVLGRMGNTAIVGNMVYFRGNQYATLSAKSEPPSALVIVDDIEDREGYILEMNPFISELESVEVVKGVAVLAGSVGGAIIITTKRGVGKSGTPYAPRHIAKFNPLGFQAYAEFYSPKYETQEEKENGKPDLRSTIYWNPNVRLVDGKAQVKFYTADEASTYAVFIDGLTNTGEPLHVINKIGE